MIIWPSGFVGTHFAFASRESWLVDANDDSMIDIQDNWDDNAMVSYCLSATMARYGDLITQCDTFEINF